jgi:spore germination protein GerM
MPSKRKLSLIIIILVLIIASAAWFFILKKKTPSDSMPGAVTDFMKTQETNFSNLPDTFTIKVYYPIDSRINTEERKIKHKATQIAIAEAVITEFLKGPINAKTSDIPANTKLLGLYKGTDDILYVDLSDEFRRNFNGDMITEFLLLKAFFESVIANVPDINDIKILIESKELETLGGHLYIMYPLKNIVAVDISEFLGRKEAEAFKR